jgi:hypothetical protein
MKKSFTVFLTAALLMQSGQAYAAASCGLGHIKVFGFNQGHAGNGYSAIENLIIIPASLPAPSSYYDQLGAASMITITQPASNASQHEEHGFNRIYNTLHAAYLSGANVTIASYGSSCKGLTAAQVNVRTCADIDDALCQ